MTKKNEAHNYTFITPSQVVAQFISKNSWSIIMAVITSLTAVVGLLFASKLAPLYQSDAVIITRVDALESSDFVPRKEVDNRLGSIEKRLGTIDQKLDTLLLR